MRSNQRRTVVFAGDSELDAKHARASDGSDNRSRLQPTVRQGGSGRLDAGDENETSPLGLIGVKARQFFQR